MENRIYILLKEEFQDQPLGLGVMGESLFGLPYNKATYERRSSVRPPRKLKWPGLWWGVYKSFHHPLDQPRKKQRKHTQTRSIISSVHDHIHYTTPHSRTKLQRRAGGKVSSQQNIHSVRRSGGEHDWIFGGKIHLVFLWKKKKTRKLRNLSNQDWRNNNCIQFQFHCPYGDGSVLLFIYFIQVFQEIFFLSFFSHSPI